MRRAPAHQTLRAASCTVGRRPFGVSEGQAFPRVGLQDVVFLKVPCNRGFGCGHSAPAGAPPRATPSAAGATHQLCASLEVRIERLAFYHKGPLPQSIPTAVHQLRTPPRSDHVTEIWRIFTTPAGP